MKIFKPKLTILQGCIVSIILSFICTDVIPDLAYKFLYYPANIQFSDLQILLHRYIKFGIPLVIGYYIKNRYIQRYLNKRNVIIVNNIKQWFVKIIDLILSVLINSILPFLCWEITWFIWACITLGNID